MDLRFGFRAKLLVIVATAAAAFLLLILAGTLTAQRAEHELSNIQDHYLPRVELGPQLSARFEQLRQGFQDAVAAHDLEALAALRERRDGLLEQLNAARGALDPAQVNALAGAINDYYSMAHDVSRRLIAGETGESLVDAMAAMQMQHSRTAELLTKTTSFDRNELTAAFAAAARSQSAAGTARFLVSICCLLLVLLLSLWISRGLVQSISGLAAGLDRFGRGEFNQPIPVFAADELGDVAKQANLMAESLKRLGDERNQINWMTSGQAGLAQEVRGELSVREVARQSTTYLANQIRAPAGALYEVGSDGELLLLAQHGLSPDDAGARSRIPRGEGLLGEAALRSEITVVQAVPANFLRLRSGLGEGAPGSVVFLPLIHTGKVVGVLELAIFRAWTTTDADFLLSIRETLAIALEVARSRERMRELFHDKELQAERLLTQEEALRQANRELHAGQLALQRKAEEVAAASAYKSQFLANMSHELRTPLNAIIGFSEMLQDGLVQPDHPNYRESLGYILNGGRHLLKLINDVLDLSKVEAGKLEFNPEPVDLSTAIGDMLAVLRSSANAKGVTIEATVDPALTGVVIDPSRLKQIVYNYSSNALKFSPHGGRVFVRAVAENEEWFRLEVEDNGVGISPENLSRLFVEFQQVGSVEQQRGGTGLGLALTKRLVEAQGGRVGVRSTVGKGSVFSAVLRRVSAVGNVHTLVPNNLGSTASGSNTVLVVEDDPVDRAALVEALAKEGYAVEVAGTGAQALALCKTRTFHAMTLDLLLPDTNGLEVLRQLRSDERTRSMPVVVVTLVAEPGVVAGFSVTDILAKPLDSAALTAALLNAGVPARQPGPVLVVDDDPGARQLMSTMLTDLGYESVCEPDGEAGLRAVSKRVPRAVVLDLMMPGMNGFDFLARFRQEPGCRRVPVIVWTMKDLTNNEIALLRATAQAIVAKSGVTEVIDELRSFVPVRPGEGEAHGA